MRFENEAAVVQEQTAAAVPGISLTKRKPRAKAGDIRRFIIDQVDAHGGGIAKRTASVFGMTRQGVHKHLRRLVEEGVLAESGKTRNHWYRLVPLPGWDNTYPIMADLAEDVVWTREVRSTLGELPDNVLLLWRHGFSEMFNNAVDHSQGMRIHIGVRRTAATIEMTISDDGMGIFKTIRDRMRLADERHAIRELAKGKLTTDPAHHTGEGIFFTARMFDSFDLLSEGMSLSHGETDATDWVREHPEFAAGTTVWMRLRNDSARANGKVFEEYVSARSMGSAAQWVSVRRTSPGVFPRRSARAYPLLRQRARIKR